MLESGIDTDIVSGRPTAEKRAKPKEAEAVIGYRKTVLEALDLAAELQKGSPILALMVRQYRERLSALAAQDPECQMIEKAILAMRVTLEVRPRMAEERMRQMVGPHLEPFIDLGDQVAPDGIPASA